MKEVAFYAPMIKGAAEEGWDMFHPQEGAAKAPFDLCGILTIQVMSATANGYEWHATGTSLAKPVGLGVAAEVKVVARLPRDYEGLPWRLFKTHQRTWLEAWAGAGGLALVVLCADTPAREIHAYVLKSPADFDSTARELPSAALRKEGTDKVKGWGALVSLWARPAPREA